MAHRLVSAGRENTISYRPLSFLVLVIQALHFGKSV